MPSIDLGEMIRAKSLDHHGIMQMLPKVLQAHVPVDGDDLTRRHLRPFVVALQAFAGKDQVIYLFPHRGALFAVA